MLKKTFIATATAGLIAAGALVGTATSASAAGVYFGGPGWSVGIGGPGWGPQRPHQVCKPVFKTVKWWDHWGKPHFKKIVVSQRCWWSYGPYQHRNGNYPHQGQWGGNGQYGQWGGNGPHPGPGGYPHP